MIILCRFFGCDDCISRKMCNFAVVNPSEEQQGVTDNEKKELMGQQDAADDEKKRLRGIKTVLTAAGRD